MPKPWVELREARGRTVKRMNVAYDEEALELMRMSGCQGMLVGFESLEPTNLKQMNKGFNMMHGGPREALANFRRHGIRIYGTFIFNETDEG